MAGTEQLMSMATTKVEYKLYVGDLDENCNETILKQNFGQFGAVRAQVNKAKRKRYPGEHSDRYYGIVYLSSKEEMERAKMEMDQQVILNNRIRVCLYRNYFDRVETDVYLKGVEKVTSAQVKTALDSYGPVFSVKLAQEKTTGASLNYGYLSFTDKEAKEKCLAQLKGEKVDVDGQMIEVLPFTPYAKRSKNQTNIYVKNLPGPAEGLSLEQVRDLLMQEAQSHGEIVSCLVKFEAKLNKHFGFICYKETEDAKKAYSHLATVLIKGLPLEVNWAQKKDERMNMNYQNLKSNVKKTNIFLKNLVEDVDEQKLKEAFEKYGVITSVCVKTPSFTPAHVTTKTKFGFINYQQEAQSIQLLNAVRDKELSEELKELFLLGEAQVVLFKPKEQLLKQKQSGKHALSQQNIMQMMQQMSSNPMMFYQTMQQMMMMNMMMLNKSAGSNGQRGGQQPFPKNMMMKPMQMPMMGQGAAANMQMPMMPGMMQMPNMQHMPMQMGAPGMAAAAGGVSLGVGAQQPNRVAVPQQMMSQKLSASSLKENLSEFLKYDQDKQRALLGELLFPLVSKYADGLSQAPKITGMLIDFEVFEVSEILEFLENEELLKERVKEAEELIENTTNN